MKTKIFVNPYYCYILSFGIALFIYSWGWSEIYPSLSIDVVFFLLFTFSIAFILGLRVSRKIIYIHHREARINYYIVSLIVIGYIIEFIYNGGIPIMLIFSGVDISYMEFGIPTFHVLLHTFTSFYTIYTFQNFIDSKKKHNLIVFAILILPNVLIINRGALIMTLTACGIIYLFSIRKVVFSKVLYLIMGLIIFFYGFGYMGNVRSFNGDSLAFPKFTKATSEFVDGYVPKEFYWFYIYASSPFANFQNSTIESKQHRYDVTAFITWELLPDFISKRIVPIEDDYDGLNRMTYSINPILTVGSIYFEPYIRMGWIGPITVFAFFALIIYSYLIVVSTKSKYFNTGLSILCVISIFNMFENMINFSGLSVQLIYPLIFSKLERYSFNIIPSKRLNLRFRTVYRINLKG